jgi:nitrous oxidase accessory protein
LKTLYFIVFLSVACISSARVKHVGAHSSFKAIKAAIQASSAGDTIIVHQGLYKEGNLIIDKPLTLLGVNFPVLDGQKKYEVVSIKAPRVIFKGFKVVRSGYGTLDDPGAIKVYDQDHVVISDNILDDNFFGIYIQYGKFCTIRNNKIKAYGDAEQQIGNGIHCWKSDNLLIEGNTISGHRDGIYFEFVTQSRIRSNLSTNNIRYGLHFMFSNNDSYIGNTFRNNGAGVAVMFTNHVDMIDNVFEENWGDAAYGLMLKEISDGEIRGNKFSKNTAGIYMEGTNRMVVKNNRIEAKGWGLKIQASCMDNKIVNNNFIGNTFDVSTNGQLVLNSFAGNYWDKYEGYDLNRDGIGDVPYHPLSMFSVIVENNPPAMLLFRSFMTTLLDRSEKMIPSLTPDNFIDKSPALRQNAL